MIQLEERCGICGAPGAIAVLDKSSLKPTYTIRCLNCAQLEVQADVQH